MAKKDLVPLPDDKQLTKVWEDAKQEKSIDEVVMALPKWAENVELMDRAMRVHTRMLQGESPTQIAKMEKVTVPMIYQDMKRALELQMVFHAEKIRASQSIAVNRREELHFKLMKSIDEASLGDTTADIPRLYEQAQKNMTSMEELLSLRMDGATIKQDIKDGGTAQTIINIDGRNYGTE